MTDTSQNILDALDISSLPADEQEALLLDLGDLVFRGSMLRMIERMDGSTKEEFDRLMETDPSEDEITSFLKDRVTGADAVVEETLQDIRNDILAVTGT